MYRPASAAEALDVSKATLWRLVARGEIATVKKDGCTFILRAELDRFISRLSDAA
jgi:predicted site-specific integrase-resolvase